jgi:uncharacterized protein (TIGR04255 family)
VIEVGIEFHFDPRPDKAAWDLPVARPFFERLQQTFPHVEVVQAEQIRIEKRTPGGIPETISGQISLDRVRARNLEGTRWVQVANDLLVCNLVRQGNTYPGFDSLRDDALAKLDQYIEHFQPVSVRQVAVNYLDLVEIPFPGGNGILRLDDYLRVRMELPDEPFGPVGAFSLQLQFPRRKERDQVALLLHTFPPDMGRRVGRFQMHWHCLCEEVCSLDRNEITRRLGAAHERLASCFQASFTEKGWELFRPVETR